MTDSAGAFTLTFDPTPTEHPHHPNGYWYCYAEPGYDGSGDTSESAMAACIMAMSAALQEKEVEGNESTYL